MNRRHFLRNSAAAAVLTGLYGNVALAQAMRQLANITSDVNAITGDGREINLEQAAVRELADSLRGNLLLTGSEGYDAARRVLNKSIDKFPALIVQPSGAADIQNAVTFARERGLLVAVKCGGHSFSGKSTCDGGMQIDLSRFRHVRVNPAARTARVSGGSLLGDMDHETMAHGLVTTAGTVSHTGVGGLTLGGGFGRVGRRFGLALDNVRAVDIVTADGVLRHANEEQNPDLHWAVRGGGGNFGVITSFEFQLHPMQRQVVGGEVVFPISAAKDVMRFYAELSESAPDDLYLDCVMVSPPGGADGIILIHACYSGDPGKADRALQPLMTFGKPLNNSIRATDYVAIQKSWDNSDPRNGGEYLKSGFASGISENLIDALVDAHEAHPERTTTAFFQHSGGAISRVPESATAFAHRFASHSVFTTVAWEPGVDRTEHVRYVRAYWDAIDPHTRGFYTNEIADEAQSVVNENYRGNFERLLSIKREYDPTNLFRLNANIRAT